MTLKNVLMCVKSDTLKMNDFFRIFHLKVNEVNPQKLNYYAGMLREIQLDEINKNLTTDKDLKKIANFQAFLPFLIFETQVFNGK